MPGFVSVLSNGRKRRTYTFSEAVLLGWAPDGGMFWPESVPHLDPATLRRWAALPYASLCAELLKLFIAGDKEMSESDIDSICGGAFERFGAPSTVEVRPLSVPTMVGKGATGASEDGYHVCELWHGPTLAFKDLGMAVLARTLGHLLRKRGERLTLLVGTSGDTGSSAMEAVRGMGDVLQLVVLYPLQGYSAITPTQEAQMAAVPPAEPHIHLVGVEGSSDELDVPMAACFQDATYRDK
jgi:threonine synthase